MNVLSFRGYLTLFPIFISFFYFHGLLMNVTHFSNDFSLFRFFKKF